MIFLDSSYLYVLFNPFSKFHKDALRLKEIYDDLNSTKVINSLVLSEILNKTNKLNIFPFELYALLKNNANIIYLSQEDYMAALCINRDYGYSVNYSDCIILKTMQDLSITKILSFDSDFDKINGITRIC